jgi:hypothetical protein
MGAARRRAAKALPVRATLDASDGVAQSENVFTRPTSLATNSTS